MSENYKGSIELISGLVQKNKGDFPLMEASAVAFYEETQLEDGSTVITEIRLPEKLKTIGISDKDKETLIQNAVTATINSESFTGLSTNIKTNAENIASLDEELENLAQVVAENAGDNKKLIVHYDTVAQKLYLYEQDENGEIEFDPGTGTIIKVNQLSETTIQGGGGGGTGAAATYKLSLKIADDTKDSFSILEGRQALLNYTVKLTSAETDVNTGEVTYVPITGEKITYSIYKDNIYQKAITEDTVKDGAIDVTDLLTLGVNNFKVTASVIEYVDGVNADGEAETVAITTRASARWTVNVVNMKLEVPNAIWEATPKYSATSFNYTPIGALSKTIHFILDGEEVHTETTSLNGTSLVYTIPMQTHGVHTFEIYCEGTIEDETITTDVYKYVLMFIDSSNTTTPIIRIKAPTTAEQYSATRLYFNVYDPLDEIVDFVEIYEDDVLKNTYTDITSTEQYWDYKPQTEGTKVIKFKYQTTEASVSIEVSKFPYDITPTLGDLMVDFVPTGRTNQDIDYNIFKNNAYTVTTDTETGETITEEIPMNWTFSDNFDWVNGGWRVDNNGDAYFCVKAGTRVSFDYNLFAKDNTLTGLDAQDKYVAGTGKEFKLIFKTSNVARSDATWLSCMANALNDNQTGIEMQVHNAYVKSSSDTLEIPYSEEDVIEFDMNIVPMTEFSADNQPVYTSKVIPMIMTYEDGTPVQPKVLTNPATSFKQATPVPITIGSDYCDVHIYRLKIYERYLSEAEILNNFIADARSGEEMSTRYKRNQIYLPGQTSFGGKEQDLIALAEACPDLRVYLLSAPYFTNNKSDKVGNTTIKQWYFKNGKDSLYDNWVAEGATHNGQGTSSNEYGYSGRNLEFNMKKTDFLLADNQTRVSKVPLTETSVPTNYFNFKINIASSENANNALLQKRYDRYLPYTTLAAENDDRIKNSMEFYNCVVFIQETNEDLSTHREFNDTNIHFYGIGNIGDSKKTDSTRVNDKNDTAEFCVEIMDWNRYLSSFPVDTMINAMSFNINETTGEKEYVWATDDNLDILYELIDGEYVLTTDSTVDYNKIYYVDILEHDDFSEDFNYGWRYITEYEKGDEVDGTEITEEQADELNEAVQAPARQVWKDFYRFITRDLTTDGVEDSAKIAAWKTEFADWFILDSALYYYLFTLRYTMVDNRAKNSFWHYGKCPDGKYRFEFWDYDNDTALGIDNAGKLEIPFGVEDPDTDSSGAPYFRANDSTFFTRVAKYFASELNDMWIRVEQNTALGNAFDSTNFIAEFDNWQAQFPEELWRLDYERKYKRPYVGGEGSDWDNALPKMVEGNKVTEKRYLTEMMNGRKKYQRRQFERNQDFYMASKFYGTKNTSTENSITLRGSGNSSSHVIPADYTLTVVPFNNMYLNLHDGTNNFYHRRVYAGETYPINLLDTISKLDLLYIRGASNLQSLGDLSLMYLQTATLSKGSKLKNVTLGNKIEGYVNNALQTLEIGESNRLLEELDIRNLSNLNDTNLPVTSIPSLKRVYAQGSNIQTAIFANNGLLEEAYLPASINQLQLENLYFLKTLEVESYANLTNLTVRNCNNVDALNIINQAPKLNRLRLTGIEWTFETTDTLNRLYEIDSILTGYVHVDAIRRTELDNYANKWPDLEVHYSRIITQYDLSFYNQNAVPGTDEPLLTYKVDTNTTLYPYLHDPTQNGMMSELPTIPDSEDGQFTYTFADWSPSMEPTIDTQGNENYLIVDQNINFFATYNKEKKKYTVTWYGYNNQVLETQEVEYGSSATYTGDTPKRVNLTDAYFLFGGWEQSASNVTRNMEIYPIWLEANPTSISTTITSDLSPVEVYSLAQYTKDQNYNFTQFEKYIPLDSEITVQLGYMPDFEDVESIVFEDAIKTYTGLAKDIVVTDQNLFNPLQSFTLAIDFTPAYYDISSSQNTIASCSTTSGSWSGFRVYSNTAGSNVNPNLPVVQWNGQSAIQINSSHTATNENTYREICVIRYNANEEDSTKKLYIYTNNRFSFDGVIEKISEITTSLDPFSAPLSFGGRVNASGSAVTGTYAKGTIHYAKLWLGDLGAEECKKICSWTYDTMKFERVDNQRYSTETQFVTSSFVATELLEEGMSFLSSRASKGWDESSLRQWLNEKMFKALSPEWKQIILPTVVYSLTSKNSPYTSPTNSQLTNHYTIGSTVDNLYIPALYEIHSSPGFNGSGNAVDKLNLYVQEYGPSGVSNPYKQYTAENVSARIKKYKNSDVAGPWWTRSANLGYAETTNYVKPDGSADEKYYYNKADSDSVYIYNENKAGVLIAFSI